MKKGLILLAFAAAFGSAHALVIDDFTTGPYSVSLQVGDDLAFQAAAVPGDERTTYLSVQANPLSQFADLSVGGGFGVVSSGTLADVFTQLGYGYTSDGSGGYLLDDMDLDLSGEDRFRVVFEANDLAQTMTIAVNPFDGDASFVDVAVPGGISSSTIVDVPFALFTSDMSDINQLVFQFDTPASGDFAISSVQAVPEPGTLAGLSLAGLAILRRRRSR